MEICLLLLNQRLNIDCFLQIAGDADKSCQQTPSPSHWGWHRAGGGWGRATKWQVSRQISYTPSIHHMSVISVISLTNVNKCDNWASDRVSICTMSVDSHYTINQSWRSQQLQDIQISDCPSVPLRHGQLRHQTRDYSESPREVHFLFLLHKSWLNCVQICKIFNFIVPTFFVLHFLIYHSMISRNIRLLVYR